MLIQLFVGNDHLVEVVATDARTQDPINDATVTVTLRKCDGSVVSGMAWPVTLPHLSASEDPDNREGLYSGILEDGLDLRAGQTYIVDVSIDAGADSVAFYRFKEIASYRTPD